MESDVYYPGGMGPWFAALLLNVSSGSKKQTHLVGHTFPQLAEDVLNKTSGKGKAQWVMVNKVGPFQEWSQCLGYLNEWAKQVRGQSVKQVRCCFV